MDPSVFDRYTLHINFNGVGSAIIIEPHINALASKLRDLK